MNGSRYSLTYAVIAIFLLFFFAVGLNYQLFRPELTILGSNGFDHPDFSRYFPLRILSSNEFPIDDPDRRVIIVGDIHGMDRPMHALLKKLSYNPQSDVLIHVGDITSRGPHDGSMAVLSFMTTHNITGVRGNHDQRAIEWRTWLDWLQNRQGAKQWLEKMRHNWLKAKSNGVSPEDWNSYEREIDTTSWWRGIPEDWKLFSDHYWIAHDMSLSEYRYLLSLPLSLHIPSAHTFIAHAGLLSSDPRRDSTHPRQPLSHIPIVPSIILPEKANSDDKLSAMRRLQEMSILNDVPQNADPWVLLNMRSISKDNDVSKKNKGTPWSKLWNADMKRCRGFRHTNRALKPQTLPCLPSTVLYGHAAARGLDVKRWTIGLDTGCGYGKRLTALVLGPRSHLSLSNQPDIDEASKSIIHFGDDEKGHLVSVRC